MRRALFVPHEHVPDGIVGEGIVELYDRPARVAEDNFHSLPQ
jgi:hypothetical protein